MARRVKSLKHLCFDALNVPKRVRDKLFYDELVIELNCNNKWETVDETIAKVDGLDQICDVKTVKAYAKKVTVNTKSLLFVDVLRIWFLMKLYHTNECNSIALPAIKYKIIDNNMCSVIDLRKLLDAPTYFKVEPYIRKWKVPDLMFLRDQGVSCHMARSTEAEAPCIKHKNLNDWCPICIYRWAEYEELAEKHKTCCRQKAVNLWCDKCLKMRRNMLWASLVHLLAR